MSCEVVTVTPDVTLPEAHRLMTTYHIRRLPVTRQGQLVGIVTLGDVREAEPSHAGSLNIWELNYLLAKVKVERIMTCRPITVSPEETLAEAAGLMLEHKISGLPVVDDEGEMVGIITESDIFRRVVKEWQAVESIHVH
jgi:CBS domain-containing protein